MKCKLMNFVEVEQSIFDGWRAVSSSSTCHCQKSVRPTDWAADLQFF